MADDASDYPAALDTFTTLPALKDGPPSESDYHTKYQDALVAIETALGINVDKKIGKTYADETARDAAIPSDVLGDRAFLTNRGRGCFSDGTRWWPIPQIACGNTLVTFASGTGTLTFGVTFAAAPIVTCNVSGGTGPFELHVASPTTTQISLGLYSGGVAVTGDRTIAWQAINGTFG